MSADEATERLREKAKEAKDRQTAYHEAAHVLLARLYGRELVSVSLDPGQTVIEGARSAAILNAEGALSPSDEEYVMQDVKIAMAGYLGEIVGIGRAHPASPSKDIEKANAILRRLKGRVSSGLGLQEEVKAELIRNRESLVRIAEALLIARKLSPKQVNQLMGPE